MMMMMIEVKGPILAKNIGLQYQQITVQRVVGSESDAAHPGECTMMWCFNFVIHTMVTLVHNAHAHQCHSNGDSK